MDARENRAAMEQAGFAIRLDMKRPEGYLLLGELNLREGDLLEARRSFAAALARSSDDLKCAALAGLARTARLAGDVAAARRAYDDALGEDDTDPLNLRGELAELLLRDGDATAARRVLAACDDETADVFVVSAIAAWADGDVEAGVAAARRACLANLFLAPLLRGEGVPELGIVTGVDEASPEHAAALVDRLGPYLRAHQGAAELLTAVARHPECAREVDELVRLARALRSEPGAAARNALKRAIARLRDPERIRAGLLRGLPPIQPPRASFEV
jgi:hypothetical protein